MASVKPQNGHVDYKMPSKNLDQRRGFVSETSAKHVKNDHIASAALLYCHSLLCVFLMGRKTITVVKPVAKFQHKSEDRVAG